MNLNPHVILAPLREFCSRKGVRREALWLLVSVVATVSSGELVRQAYWRHISFGLRSIPIGLTPLLCLMIGMMAGLRSRTLFGWVFGASVGCFIGILDREVFLSLIRSGWLHPSQAFLVPTMSLVGTSLCLAPSNSARTVLSLIAMAAFLDCGARGLLVTFYREEWGNDWLFSSNYLVYAPGAAWIIVASGFGSAELLRTRESGKRWALGRAGVTACLITCISTLLCLRLPRVEMGPLADSGRPPWEGTGASFRSPFVDGATAFFTVRDAMVDAGVVPFALPDGTRHVEASSWIIVDEQHRMAFVLCPANADQVPPKDVEARLAAQAHWRTGPNDRACYIFFEPLPADWIDMPIWYVDWVPDPYLLLQAYEEWGTYIHWACPASELRIRAAADRYIEWALRSDSRSAEGLRPR